MRNLGDPAYLSVPDYYRTYGDEVADVAAMANFAPDREQRMILDAAFAVDRRGLSIAFETCAVCCRQNLKTGVFKQMVLGWMFVIDVPYIVWSAHEFSTAEEAFRDLEELITGSDTLRKRVKSIMTGNGKQAITLLPPKGSKRKSGPRIVFKTRTATGGRGLSAPKVILDEAFALQAHHMGALLPLVSAQPDPQVFYGSSAGLATSAVLRGVRDRGRAGRDPRLAYFEWCAPDPVDVCKLGTSCSHSLDAPGCGCDKPELWQKANPAMGRRIAQETIAAERRALPPSEFARERMGWWDDPSELVTPLTLVAWENCKDFASQMIDPVAFGIHVRADQGKTVIAASGRRSDGLRHGEIIHECEGTAGVIDRLVELSRKHEPCAVVLDPSTQAGALIKDLNQRGFVADPVGDVQRRLVLVTAREYSQGCGALVKDINEGLWRHRGQDSLQAAVNGLKIRALADSYAWSEMKSASDITSLIALTHAKHGFATFGYEIQPEPFALLGRR